MPIDRILRSYLAAARYEFMQTLRAPAFAFPFLVLPAVLYLLFGVLMAGQSPDSASATNPQVANLSDLGILRLRRDGPGRSSASASVSRWSATRGCSS